MGESLYSEQLGLFKEQLRNSPFRAYRIFGLSLLYSLDPNEVTREKYRLGINPRSAHDYYNMAVLANREGRHRDAEILYRRAEEVGGDFPEIFYNLGLTYEKLEETAKAVKAFQKFADLTGKENSEEAKAEVREVKSHIRELKG